MEKNIKVSKRYEEKGITLIALVVTIIVLLILAGVSISMLTGENGILGNAKKAKNEQTIAQVEERMKMAASAVKMEIMAKRAQDGNYDAQNKYNADIKPILVSDLPGYDIKDPVNGANETQEITIEYTESSVGTIRGKITLGKQSAEFVWEGKVGAGTITPPAGGSTGITYLNGKTKETIAPGDEIQIGSEHFYVLSKNTTTNKVRAIAKYNLDALETAPKQLSEVGGYCAFSGSYYWGSYTETRGEKLYVFPGECSFKTRVEKYKDVLGASITKVELASYEEIKALTGVSNYYPISNTYSWLWSYGGGFWLGSAGGTYYNSVWDVNASGYFYNSGCDTSNNYGVRPVIEF